MGVGPKACPVWVLPPVAMATALALCSGCGLVLDFAPADDDGQAKDGAVGEDAGVVVADARARDGAPLRDGAGGVTDAMRMRDGAWTGIDADVPPNDTCEAALELVEGDNVGLTLCGATDTTVITCSTTDVGAPDLYFRIPWSGGGWLVEIRSPDYVLQELSPMTCDPPPAACGLGFVHVPSGSIVVVERADGRPGCGTTFSIYISPM